MTNPIVTISAQIPSSLDQKLLEVCALEDRSKSYFVKKALEQFLDEKLQDIEDYHEAKKLYAEFKKSGEKAIPFEKVFKKTKKK